MTTRIVPTDFGIPHFDLRVDLSGVEYLIALKYNQREGFWYLDLATEDGEVLIASSKVVVGSPLIYALSDERRPPGDLIALDTEDADGDPVTVADLGGRVLLVYQEPL